MGQVKDHSFLWKKRDPRRRDRTFTIPTIPMEKPKVSVTEESPKIRYSNDGFWTTQHPAAKAFSIEWFKTHIVMIPYCWAMLKMATSVSRLSVAKIALGTVGRAIVDAAQLYAYTRFVNEVSPKEIKYGLTGRHKIPLFTKILTPKSCVFLHC
jgi:hypothetical protein